MHGTEPNPYSAPSTTLPTFLPRRKFCFHALFSTLSFTLIYTMSFFFLGATIGPGFAFAWQYTQQMIFDFPALVVTVLVSNALLRHLILSPTLLKHVWMTVLSGIASFHVFPWYWEYCDTLIQASLPPNWTDLVHALLMGFVPAFVGIVIEAGMSALNSAVMKAKRALVA